jgi:hypothetical protein
MQKVVIMADVCRTRYGLVVHKPEHAAEESVGKKQVSPLQEVMMEGAPPPPQAMRWGLWVLKEAWEATARQVLARRHRRK